MENSGEFTTGSFTPQARPPFRRKRLRERFPKEKASNREVACDRVFATLAGADLSEKRNGYLKGIGGLDLKQKDIFVR